MRIYFARLIMLGIALGSGLSLGTSNALADLEVSASVQISAATDFYEPLGASGTWVEVGTYGRCWHPAHVIATWRPYCDGTWVWTDCGWYWESDEPWSWACYHYGSWIDDPGLGWIWIPGVEWAPAWVYWREGGGHIGWAPCGPHDTVAAPSSFVFVEERHFNDRHRSSDVIINNTTIINATTEISSSSRENRDIGGRQQAVVVNHGPDVNNIQKASGRKIKTVSIQTADHQTKIPPAAIQKFKKPVQPETAPAVREQPQTAPVHKPLPDTTSDFPNTSRPSEQKPPVEKHEITPPEQPKRTEVPLQTEPTPPVKHEPVPNQQPPLRAAPEIHPSAPPPQTEKQQNQGHDKEGENKP